MLNNLAPSPLEITWFGVLVHLYVGLKWWTNKRDLQDTLMSWPNGRRTGAQKDQSYLFSPTATWLVSSPSLKGPVGAQLNKAFDILWWRTDWSPDHSSQFSVSFELLHAGNWQGHLACTWEFVAKGENTFGGVRNKPAEKLPLPLR